MGRQLMAAYVVASFEESGWVVDVEEFAAALRERWAGVRIGAGSVGGSSMRLEAVIPLEPAPRELGVALSGTGQAVSLDPADAEAAAEFAVWFVRRVLPGQRGLHLIEPGSMRSVELSDQLSAGQILRSIG